MSRDWDCAKMFKDLPGYYEASDIDKKEFGIMTQNNVYSCRHNMYKIAHVPVYKLLKF